MRWFSDPVLVIVVPRRRAAISKSKRGQTHVFSTQHNSNFKRRQHGIEQSSYLCVELLNRGHTVVGVSRDPEKLGKHPQYIPRSINIDEASVADLAKSFHDIDVLVSEYGPHTEGPMALLYSA
jgi:hypothetical protein